VVDVIQLVWDVVVVVAELNVEVIANITAKQLVGMIAMVTVKEHVLAHALQLVLEGVKIHVVVVVRILVLAVLCDNKQFVT
jgi:hypothetical protein